MDDQSTSVERADEKTVRIEVVPNTAHAGMVSPPDARDAEPSLQSQCEILSRIGGGGMGEVFLARDRKLGRYVAVKRLSTTQLSEANMKERFFREARAVASLNHIYIVHIYALGEDKDGPYIVMEYVAGPKPAERPDQPAPAMTLAERVRREGPLPLDAALELLLKLCRAVEYAHGCHVIHRDLKPTNVLLDESGEPKIADFGLARIRKHDTKPLTLPGEQMLSIGYGAPEQEADASLTDERADVYGLGALLYFCITGDNPRYFRPHELPEVLRMPIVKALETDREQRWASVKEFRAALAQTRAPSDTKLSTAKTTWRCKWCDTINPIAIRYCGKCGWDGGVFCPECASESRFGVQFCGVCGTDAKAYENARRVAEAMAEHMKRRDYALVEQEERNIAGFKPQGVNGREVLDRMRQLVDQASSARRRRDRLRVDIQREFDRGGYRQAGAYIREYSALSFDEAFAEMESRLEGLQYKADLKQLRSAVEDGQWLYARRLGETLLETHDTPDVRQLLRRTRRRLQTKRVTGIAGMALIVLLVYMLSSVPVFRLSGQPSSGAFHTVYRPLRWMHDATLLRVPLSAYARRFDSGAIFER